MLGFFVRNNQLGFKPGDSSIINQRLAAIFHGIYKSFDACLDVGAVFLDIAKAIDKAQHQGLLYKLKQDSALSKLKL